MTKKEIERAFTVGSHTFFDDRALPQRKGEPTPYTDEQKAAIEKGRQEVVEKMKQWAKERAESKSENTNDDNTLKNTQAAA